MTVTMTSKCQEALFTFVCERIFLIIFFYFIKFVISQDIRENKEEEKLKWTFSKWKLMIICRRHLQTYKPSHTNTFYNNCTFMNCLVVNCICICAALKKYVVATYKTTFMCQLQRNVLLRQKKSWLSVTSIQWNEWMNAYL